jgi:hypothetical protein
LALPLIALAPVAGATDLKSPLLTCTQPDCKATTIIGRIHKTSRFSFVDSHVPWVAQIFADSRECLRLRVTEQTHNTRMIVLFPVGTGSINTDDGGSQPCPKCPAVSLRVPPGEGGWFTVYVGHSQGVGVDGEFTLKYARYERGNPNCPPR